MSTKSISSGSPFLNRKENYLFWGLSLYTFGLLLPIFFSITYVGAGFCFLGLTLMIAALMNMPLSLLPKDKYFLFIFKMYIFWSVIIFVRGIFDTQDGRDFLFYLIEYKFGLIPFVIVPMLVLFGNNLFFFKRLFSWIFIYAIVFIIMSAVFLMPIVNSSFNFLNIFEFTGRVESLIKSLYLPVSFILLTIPLHNNRVKFISIVALCLALIISFYFARRNLIFSIGLAGIFTLLLYSFTRLGVKRRFWFNIAFFTLLGISYYYVSNNLDSSIFRYMGFRIEEGLGTSREGVENDMFKDFANYPLDYIWGRGGNGSYYITGNIAEIDNSQRRSMETGYLAMILKGGVLYLVLHLLILIQAVYKGLFRSNNFFVKASALFIIISILELGPAGCNRATLYSFMTWFLVGLCYNRGIRAMNNKAIQSFFIS